MPARRRLLHAFDRFDAPAVRRFGSSLQGFRRAVRLISDLTINMKRDIGR
jgi:hypothetical protein